MKYQSNTINCTVKKQSVSFGTDCFLHIALNFKYKPELFMVIHFNAVNVA